MTSNYFVAENGVTRRSRRFSAFIGCLRDDRLGNNGNIYIVHEVEENLHFLLALAAGFVRGIDDDFLDILVHDGLCQLLHIHIFLCQGDKGIQTVVHFFPLFHPFFDTLLSAMESAGGTDMPDEAERKGLGTPATRAAIIEKLVSAGFLERKGKNLIPTKAGLNLVTVLPEPLTSPMLTAEWEQKLTDIAKGGDADVFLNGIRAMVEDIVSTYSHISEEGQKLFAPEKETVGNCPRCGKPVYEGKKNFACSDRSCSFVLWKNDRFWTSRKKELTKKMAIDLLTKGRTNIKGLWSEKRGETYDATVILDDTGGKYINFKMEFSKRKDGTHGRK